MKIALFLAAIAFAIFAVDRLLLWLEWRGWIDYRRTNPGRMRGSNLGPAFLAVQSLLEPDKVYVLEEQTAVRTERSGIGEPPVAGTDDLRTSSPPPLAASPGRRPAPGRRSQTSASAAAATPARASKPATPD